LKDILAGFSRKVWRAFLGRFGGLFSEGLPGFSRKVWRAFYREILAGFSWEISAGFFP
jgi:hypothetical protein